jgi:hypothetical protein
MRTLTTFAFIVVAACGGGSGNPSDIDAAMTADAKVFLDAPPIVPQMITIAGKTTERSISGETNVAGVTMTIFSNSNETTAIATAMSDAQGAYTMQVPTNGAPIDGYLVATKNGYVDIFLYPSSPFIDNDMGADVNMMTPSNKDFLNSLASGGQTAGKGMIGLQVRDASGPVTGATISSMPASGAYRYNGSNGLPSSSATTTSSDGVAFMFNVPSGAITVTATKAGMTFKAHIVKARADKFTTTSVQSQ